MCPYRPWSDADNWRWSASGSQTAMEIEMLLAALTQA